MIPGGQPLVSREDASILLELIDAVFDQMALFVQLLIVLVADVGTRMDS